jgi:hypothetical protein
MLQKVMMVKIMQSVRQLIEVLRDVMMGGGRSGHQGSRRCRRMRRSLMVIRAQQRVVMVSVLLAVVLLRLRHRVRPSRRIENVANHETRAGPSHKRHGGQHRGRVLIRHSQHFSGSVLMMTLDAGPAG